MDIAFCGAADQWVSQGRQQPPVLGLYRYDAVHYGQIVAEPLGREQGITPETFRRAVLQNAATFAGIPTEQIVTLGVEATQVDGYDAETVSYGLELSGTPFVFINTLVLEAARNYQFVTFAVAGEITASHLEINADFLSLIDLPGGAE
jgi:hypothetical protein